MNGDLIRSAVEVIRGGGIVACATDTQVGLLASATDDEAVARLLRVKGAARQSPITVLIDRVDWARSLAESFGEHAESFAATGWPGALTLVVEVTPGTFPAEITGGGDTIGFRVPGPSPALDVVRAYGLPVTGTSANRSGAPAPATTDQISPEILDDVDMVVPGWGSGIASRVIDVTGFEPVLLREG